LETEDLSFKFSDSSKEILHGLTLKIEQGERIATVPMDLENNLIRILSGLLHPTSGSLYINDDTFRKNKFKAIPLANRQYHSWGNTF
jgi:ABC-type transport system involved in cytochrome bd biosynthesis fused ATPase/permease subunit